MMRFRTFANIAASLAVAALTAAPGFAGARGSADFTRFVVLGDSYAAGVQNGSLNERHQPHSWAADLARQEGVKTFAIPTVSYPGIGNDLQLIDVLKYPPTLTPVPGTGQPTNLNYPAPYNNLGIPGAKVADLMTLTGKDPATSTPKAFAQFILRGQGTAVQQALVQQPTFIALWIGGNDALGSLLAGNPAGLTPLADFKTQYNALLDALVAGAPNAGMVVGTLPDHIGVTPIANAVKPYIINPATSQPVLGPDGKPIYYFADLGGGQLGLLPVGSYVLLTASADLASGYGIPPTLASIPPFNQLPNAGKPLPDADVVTPTEAAAIEQRASDYNTVIIQAAQARNIPVADIEGLFNRVAAGTEYVGPFQFTGSYLTGGFFSYDGFHLTDIGYALFANEFIKTINAAYGTHTPVVSIAQFLSNNGAFFPQTSSGATFVQGEQWGITPEAEAEIRAFATPAAAKPRLRAISH